MSESTSSPLKTGCLIPEVFAQSASVFGATFGVPAESVAFVMGGVLGGLMSGSRRVCFAGQTIPLGLHVVLIGTACSESARWLSELSAPLVDEVRRLQRGAPKTAELQQQSARFAQLLRESSPGIDGYDQLVAACRYTAVQLEPFLFSKVGAAEEEKDGLRAQVLFPDLRRLIYTNDAALHALAKTFYDGPGGVTAMAAALPPKMARRLATSPLLASATGWPLGFLPQDGANFTPVTDEALTGARTKWVALVEQALRIRYQKPGLLNISAEALELVNRLRQEVEVDYRERGAEVFLRHAVSAAVRLAGVVCLLSDPKHTVLEGAHMEAVLPLVRWSLAAKGTLFPGGAPKAVNARRRMPAKASFDADVKRVEAKLAKFPELSDRAIMRKLAPRPRGHWKAILTNVRAHSLATK